MYPAKISTKTQAPLRLTLLHHDREELDDDLGGGADEDLELAAALSVDNGVEGVVEDGDAHHAGEGRKDRAHARFVLLVAHNSLKV
jgi:hypothetical protein